MVRTRGSVFDCGRDVLRVESENSIALERSHQGIGNMLINGAAPQSEGIVKARDRLGGLLTYYHREAA
jgi:hypothetical protein